MGIEDYGLIGDTETAALVGRSGSIDWACFAAPQFAGLGARYLQFHPHRFARADQG